VVQFGRVGCLGASQSFKLRRQASWLKVWRGGGCRFNATERAHKRNGGQIDAECRRSSLVTTWRADRKDRRAWRRGMLVRVQHGLRLASTAARCLAVAYYRLNFPPCLRARPSVTSVSRISATSAGFARLNCFARSAGLAGAPKWCKAVSHGLHALGHSFRPSGF